MSSGRRPAPPGGMAPPIRSELPDGSSVDLLGLARTVAEAHRDEFPDEADRYGPAGLDWCVHDNQHILNWAVGARNGYVDLEKELAWLGRVLEARDFPVERLARNLEIAAEVAADLPIADDLAAGARFIRERGSFL
jgi:hypothetical protein